MLLKSIKLPMPTVVLSMELEAKRSGKATLACKSSNQMNPIQTPTPEMDTNTI